MLLNRSDNLARLGALALIAALAAVAAWTFTGRSDSSGQAPSHASKGLPNFSLRASPPKSDHDHGAKPESRSAARHRKAPRAASARAPRIAPVPVVSGPVPPRQPASLSPSGHGITAPPAKPGRGVGTLPPRHVPKGRSPGGRRPAPAPVQPRRPAPRTNAPHGGAPATPPANPPATPPNQGTAPTDPGTTPANPGTTPTDVAGDPPGVDDTAVGGLDPTDLGEPVDETPAAGATPPTAPAPAPAPAPTPAPGGAG
jgi:hypothetical protein